MFAIKNKSSETITSYSVVLKNKKKTLTITQADYPITDDIEFEITSAQLEGDNVTDTTITIVYENNKAHIVKSSNFNPITTNFTITTYGSNKPLSINTSSTKGGGGGVSPVDPTYQIVTKIVDDYLSALQVVTEDNVISIVDSAVAISVPAYINNHKTELLDGYVSTSDLNTALANYVTETDLNGYVTDTELTTALSGYVTSSDLNGYVTDTELTTALANYVTSSALSAYVTDTELSTALEGYATTSALSNYVTSTSLTTTLADYETKTELDTTLASYETKTELTATLNNYVLKSDIPTAESIADTMYSDATLITMGMANNGEGTKFQTYGYYSKTDGQGGKYLVTTTKILGGREITNGTNTVYLVALDANGAPYDVVYPARLGVREKLDALGATASARTKANTYATLNSDIMDGIIAGRGQYDYGKTLVFPKGRFYFERPIVLYSNSGQTQYKWSIQGSDKFLQSDDMCKAVNSKWGTMLFFPFLENGQAAIESGQGNITNLSIIGDIENYNLQYHRPSTIESPSSVTEETIKQVDGVDYKTTAIHKIGGGQIENVFMAYFYNGFDSATGVTQTINIALHNIKVWCCHYGMLVKNDIKINLVTAWNVHTLLGVRGALVSAIQLRADSCTHLADFQGNCGGGTFMDWDADYCTESMILIGSTTGATTNVCDCVFEGIHGRVCALKSYQGDTTASDYNSKKKKGGQSLTTGTSAGYGIFRVAHQATFHDNYVVLTTIGNANVFDSSSSYRTPDIILTYVNGSASNDTEIGLSNNIFVANCSGSKSDTYREVAEDTKAYVLSKFQTDATSAGVVPKFTFINGLGTYYVDGTTVSKASITAMT